LKGREQVGRPEHALSHGVLDVVHGGTEFFSHQIVESVIVSIGQSLGLAHLLHLLAHGHDLNRTSEVHEKPARKLGCGTQDLLLFGVRKLEACVFGGGVVVVDVSSAAIYEERVAIGGRAVGGGVVEYIFRTCDT